MDPLSLWVEQVIRESQRLVARFGPRAPEAEAPAAGEPLPEALRRRLDWRARLEP